MNVQISTQNEFKVVHVQGRVDTMSAGDFESQLMIALQGGVTRLIIDCGNLDYISSSGLRVFLVAQKKMTSIGGTLRLCNLQPTIKEIFDISGFSNIFAIFPDLESASKK